MPANGNQSRSHSRLRTRCRLVRLRGDVKVGALPGAQRPSVASASAIASPVESACNRNTRARNPAGGDWSQTLSGTAPATAEHLDRWTRPQVFAVTKSRCTSQACSRQTTIKGKQTSLGSRKAETQPRQIGLWPVPRTIPRSASPVPHKDQPVPHSANAIPLNHRKSRVTAIQSRLNAFVSRFNAPQSRIATRNPAKMHNPVAIITQKRPNKLF